MSCCGRNRTPLLEANVSTFQYIGAGRLTVRGRVSGQLYRFASPGAVVIVAARDVASMELVPLLRRF